MTTAPARRTSVSGVGILLGAGLICLVAGVAAAVVGGIVAGSAAAYGALAATLIVLVVFGGGAFVVNLVASVLPSASLMIAMLTYALQVVLMGLVFLVLSNSGLLDDALDRRWLGGTVIVGTAAWLVCQIVVATRVRIPAYDLKEAGAR